ncbi:MAG: amino acid ABC transporter ATP-binding protein, partial [Clostridia bacterium]|nr:amino acid ABC transporter ATP-binding protein [Clostridia bacterium]
MSMIRTEHVSKRFGHLEVLKDVNLTVENGEVICIIGPSGAGKSTFLRSLNQLEMITGGKIFIEDELFLHREHDRTVESIDKEKHKALMLEMGMVFQHFNLFPHKTVLENLMLAPMTVKGKSQAEIEPLARQLLEEVGLSDKADVYPS